MDKFEEKKKAAPAVYVDNDTNMAVVAKRGSAFSLSRMAGYCKNGKYAERVGAGTPIYIAAVLEYLVFEILELSQNEALKEHKSRINPTHIMLAIKNDPELSKLLKGQFVAAGFAPKVRNAAPRNGKKDKKVVDDDDE